MGQQQGRVCLMKIENFLKQSSYPVYRVGGCVRDQLLHRPIHDIDLAIVCQPDELARLVNRKVNAFGSVQIDGIDITCTRIESDYLDGRHPSRLVFGVPIEQDLKRRDFTMNAMALSDQLIDPFNGQADLKAGLLRTVGLASQRFKEDRLRLWRALRFIVCFDLMPVFELEEEAKVAKRLAYRELLPVLKTKPLALLSYQEMIFSVFPEWKAMAECEQHNPYHFTNVWVHTLLAIEACRDKSDELVSALLLHDVGKPEVKTTLDGVDHFTHHAQRSSQLASIYLQEYGMPVRSITRLIAHHDIRKKEDWPKGWSAKQLNQLKELRRADLLAHTAKGIVTWKSIL